MNTELNNDTQRTKKEKYTDTRTHSSKTQHTVVNNQHTAEK